jgi:hypothetical protein
MDFPENPARRNNGWTPERRAKQREAMLRRAPWKKSTGPKSQSGKNISKNNSFKHGHRGAEWREFYRLLATQRLFVRMIRTRRLAERKRAKTKGIQKVIYYPFYSSRSNTPLGISAARWPTSWDRPSYSYWPSHRSRPAVQYSCRSPLLVVNKPPEIRFLQ